MLATSSDKTEGPGSWRTKLVAALLLLLSGYHIYLQREEAVRRVRDDSVSCAPTEIHDLINVFHFTTQDMESLYHKTMRKSDARGMNMRVRGYPCRRIRQAHTCSVWLRSQVSSRRGDPG